MNECFECGAEISPEESAKVHAKFDDSFGATAQSMMCWSCADDWEPGDGFIEWQAEQAQREGR